MLEILYADKELVVCVKPAGVLSEGEGMPALLSAQLGGTFLCVHRLDRETGGVMVYAKTPASAARLSKLIAEGKLEKEYLAVVQGCPAPPEGVMRDLLFKDSAKNKSYVVKRMRRGVREAELSYSLVERRGSFSLVRVKLKTGRSHQIRVQFASRGMPLLGDAKYGGQAAPGLALWSYRLAFPDKNGKTLEFAAEPKGDVISVEC